MARYTGVVVIAVAVAIFIVIVGVADFGPVGVDQVVGVVTVGVVAHVPGGLVALDIADGSIAEVVAVAVGIPGGCVEGVVLVGLVVAVIVDGIAVFVGSGVGGDFTVVAVGVVAHIASGLVAIDVTHSGVAVSIGVGIRVPGQHICCVVFIGIAQAIIVHAVTQLRGSGVGRVV